MISDNPLSGAFLAQALESCAFAAALALVRRIDNDSGVPLPLTHFGQRAAHAFNRKLVFSLARVAERKRICTN